MPALKIRKLTFDFAGVPFQWLPENPRLATSINASSFFAVGFERYVAKTMRDAIPHIKDPEILEEAKLFFGQEAQHGYAHKLHIDSMIRIYPNLKSTYEKVCQHFDDLYNEKSMEFRLAYVANMESAFPPAINFVIKNREILFSRGDKNISSLFLWHAIEESEHRGSADTVYNHLVKSRWYRLKQLPAAAKHFLEYDKLIRREFELNIPLSDRMADLERPPEPLAGISYMQRFLVVLQLIRNFLPWHNAASDKPPAWFDEWMQAERDGIDMATFYGR